MPALRTEVGREGFGGGIGSPREGFGPRVARVGASLAMSGAPGRCHCFGASRFLSAGAQARLRPSLCRSQPVIPLCFAQAPERLRFSARRVGCWVPHTGR